MGARYNSNLGAEEGVVALLEREALRGADLAVVPVRVARDGRASAALHALEQQHRRLTPEVRRVGARGHAEVEPLVRYASHPALAQRMHRLVGAHLRRDHEVVRAHHAAVRQPRRAGQPRQEHAVGTLPGARDRQPLNTQTLARVVAPTD